MLNNYLVKALLFIFIVAQIPNAASNFLSSQLPEHLDSFKELGIPSFDFNFKETAPKKVKPISKAIDEDFGKLLKGDPAPGTGLKILARFLTEDDEDLKTKGGIYDETGFDGLSGGEEIFPENTEARNRQRARSAALLYVKENRTESTFEAYGCTPDKEVVPNWLAYVVLLMNDKGEHKLVKICVPKSEGGMLAFALEPNDKCSDRVPMASDFADKSRMYLQKNSMSSFFIKNKVRCEASI